MTTGRLADDAAEPGSSRAGLRRRPTAVALLALTLATAAAGLLPGAAGRAALLTVTAAGIVGASLVIIGTARSTARPRAWHWYGMATLLSVLGSSAVQAAFDGAVPPTFGALPGMLLILLPLALLIPRGTWQGVRGQLLSAWSLFAVSSLVCLLSSFVLVLGGRIEIATLRGATLYVLAAALSLSTSVTLLVLVSSPGPRRPAALLVLGGQLLFLVSSTSGALLRATATEIPPLDPTTCIAGVLGTGLVLLAALSDRSAATAVRIDIRTCPISAMLPHLTALLAGALLLLTVVVTGGVDPVLLVLGLVGLCLLVVHQAIGWHDQRALSAALQHSEAYFRAVVRASADPVVILDDQLQVTWASSAVPELLGLDPTGAVGQALVDAVHPDDLAGLVTALRPAEPGETPEGRTRTARLQHADGSWRLIRVQVRDLREDPDVGALVLYCRDVTPGSTPERAGTLPVDEPLVSTTDPATGLPNRAALVQRLAHLLRDGDARTALVKVGLAGLPGTDDDAALQAAMVEIAGRLSRVLRGDDWLVRSGPAEFAALVRGSAADAEIVATRLIGTVDPDTPIGGLRLAASAGVVGLAADTDAGETLRRAEVAMLSARSAGPGRVRRHSVALLIAQDRRDALRTDLAGALERGRAAAGLPARRRPRAAPGRLDRGAAALGAPPLGRRLPRGVRAAGRGVLR